MKNASTSRVHPNTSRKNAKSQARNGHGKPVRQYYRDTKIGLYASYGRIGKRKRIKRLVEDIDLSVDEYEQSCRASFKLRDTAQRNFWGDAIRKALAAQADDGFVDLELMVFRVQGLLQLLADKLESIRTDDSEFSGKSAETLCAGVSLMVLDAQKQLREAFDKAFHAAHPKIETNGQTV